MARRSHRSTVDGHRGRPRPQRSRVAQVCMWLVLLFELLCWALGIVACWRMSPAVHCSRATLKGTGGEVRLT